MDDDDEMVARSCTALFLTSLADGVRTLFKHDTNTLRQHPNESTTKESQKSPSPKKKTRSVKFQYPVITSTHHRPMTEDDDIENLFFTEEEMDELEDDRYNTQFADHVEVLAEGQSWDTPVFQLSTSSNLSIEEDYVAPTKQLPVKVGTVKNVMSPRSNSISARSVPSPRSKRSKMLSPRSKSIKALTLLGQRRWKRDCITHEQSTDKPKKIVEGVQIVLLEKSVDRPVPLVREDAMESMVEKKLLQQGNKEVMRFGEVVVFETNSLETE